MLGLAWSWGCCWSEIGQWAEVGQEGLGARLTPFPAGHSAEAHVAGGAQVGSVPSFPERHRAVRGPAGGSRPSQLPSQDPPGTPAACLLCQPWLLEGMRHLTFLQMIRRPGPLGGHILPGGLLPLSQRHPADRPAGSLFLLSAHSSFTDVQKAEPCSLSFL